MHPLDVYGPVPPLNYRGSTYILYIGDYVVTDKYKGNEKCDQRYLLIGDSVAMATKSINSDSQKSVPYNWVLVRLE